MVMFLEQARGDTNAGVTHAASLDNLAKILASKETGRYINKMRQNTLELGPASKSYCKQFFESFPNYYIWPMKYGFEDRETLVSHVTSSNSDETLGYEKRIQNILDLVCFDIYHKRFNKAHEMLLQEKTQSLITAYTQEYTTMTKNTTTPTTTPTESDVVLQAANLLSLYHDLMGSFYQLNCQLGKAETEYSKALHYNKNNLDAKLKSILLFVEYGETHTVC